MWTNWGVTTCERYLTEGGDELLGADLQLSWMNHSCGRRRWLMCKHHR